MEHVKEQVKKIATEGKAVDEKVLAFVREDFRKTLADCEKTGRPVKQAVHDTLDGVEAGLKAAGHESYDLVAKSAAAIVDVSRDITAQSLDAARAYGDEARAALDEALGKAFNDIDKVDTRTKEKMESAHAALHEKSEAEKARLQAVGKSIAEHAEQRGRTLGESTKTALHETAGKATGHAQAVERAGAEHSKKLLHHGETRVSTWLHGLATRMHPKH